MNLRLGLPANRAPAGRRTTPVVAVVTAAIGVLLFSSAAAAYVTFREPSTPVADMTRCYTRVSLAGGDRDFFGTTVSQVHDSQGRRTAVGAVEACAAAWRQGLLQLGSKEVGHGPDAGRAGHPVPPLVACVLDNGVAAVFPGDERTCARLKLPRLGR